MGTDRTGSVQGGLVADPEGYDSWGEQRPHRLGLFSAERTPQAADLGGMSQAGGWRGEARTRREEERNHSESSTENVGEL